MNNLFLSVINVSFICSFVILCVIGVDKICHKNYSRQWIYITWAIIAIRLLIPFNINIVKLPDFVHVNSNDKNAIEATGNTSYQNDLSVNYVSAGSKVLEEDTEDKGVGANEISGSRQLDIINHKEIVPQITLPVSILSIGTVIWLAGVVLFLFHHIMAYLFYKANLKRWSISVKNEMILEQYHSLLNELKIKRKIELVISNQVSSPILTGLIKPCIVLPSQEFTREEYGFILKHELIHYKHHDLFIKFIFLSANALHWFNPFVYYMVSLANNNVELYCDETLIAGNNMDYREAYSIALLQVMSGGAKKNHLLLSTGFGSKKDQIKNRFYQIMHAKPTKKGIGFVVSMICLVIIIGGLVNLFLPDKIGIAQTKDFQTGKENENIVSVSRPDIIENDTNQLKGVSNVLVVGIDGISNNDVLRADSILMVSISTDNNKIQLTSFLRDLYLEIPGYGKNKLSLSYDLGGTELIKKTIESNFKLTIDHTVTMNMQVFEDIINSIGGVRIELTEKEAEYLNSTNYISNKSYRNVIAGEQKLNGNQVLGYVRIRKVPNKQGENEDLGRTARLKYVISSVLKECKGSKDNLVQILGKLFPNVTSDFSLEQALIYLNAIMEEEAYTSSMTIPVEDSFNYKIQDGISMIDPDVDKNIRALEQIYE